MSKTKTTKTIGIEGALSLEEALSFIKNRNIESSRRFNESVDIAVNLGIDPKQPNQSVKGSVILPNGSGKKSRVIVFTADPKIQEESINAGAVLAGLDDLMSKIESGFLDFDCCIATPESMKKISRVAKKLGPRGLMPSPKNGTVTSDVKKAIDEALRGKVNFKNDKYGIVHCLVGKIDFDINQLSQNVKSVIKAIKDLKPESSKGKYIGDLYISTTMGTSVKFNGTSL